MLSRPKSRVPPRAAPFSVPISNIVLLNLSSQGPLLLHQKDEMNPYEERGKRKGQGAAPQITVYHVHMALLLTKSMADTFVPPD